jgi:hypothetical protein
MVNLIISQIDIYFMSKRTEFNIGETQKTSVKVNHQPGGQTNWSLGWGE